MFNSDDVGEVLCSLQSTLHKSTDRLSNEFLIEWPKWMARMEVHIDQGCIVRILVDNRRENIPKINIPKFGQFLAKFTNNKAK